MPTKEQLQAHFKAFDTNGDGFITQDELVAILTRPTRTVALSKQAAEAIFAQADRNGDGRVDYDEFAAAWGKSDLHGGLSGAATLETGDAGTQQPAWKMDATKEAELRELRKRTPEQEKANREAAAAIAEVAAKAEKASKEERAEAWVPSGKQTCWKAFDGAIIEQCLEHTQLVDLEYLVELGRRGGVLPPGKQNMPRAAFIGKDNVWRLKLWNKKRMKFALGVLVFSYAWLDWYHPDKFGAQLQALLPFLEAMLAEAKRDSPFCTVGVMVDFICLPQIPFAAESEQLAFKVALNNMFEWYYHQSTYVLLVTTPPPGDAAQYARRLHSGRGWCVMEKTAGMAVKKSWCLLDFGGYKGATDFGNNSSSPNTCIGQMRSGRQPPRSPPVFAEFMRKGVASEEIQFTKSEDAELVSRLYEEGFVATFNRVAAKEEEAARALGFQNLGWGDEEGAVLVEALRYAAERCTFPQGSVKVAIGAGNRVTDASAGEGAAVWKELEGKFHFHN